MHRLLVPTIKEKNEVCASLRLSSEEQLFNSLHQHMTINMFTKEIGKAKTQVI